MFTTINPNLNGDSIFPNINNPPVITTLIIMLVAIIMGIYIFIVYRLAVNNEFYSKDFNRTVALIVVVTAAVVFLK